MGEYDDVQHGDVLHLALEDNERQLQRRLKQLLLPDGAVPGGLHFATTWPRVGEGGMEAIEAELSLMQRPCMAIVDILERMRAPPSSTRTTSIGPITRC